VQAGRQVGGQVGRHEQAQLVYYYKSHCPIKKSATEKRKEPKKLFKEIEHQTS
jgi:hypothetical protein